MAGDFGFDPLRLGTEQELLKWFREAELQHCRWAMIGVTGILVGEIVRPDIDFYTAPQQLEGSSPFSIRVLLAIEFILFHYVEIRRWQDLKNPGSVNQDPIFKQNTLQPHEVGYPGGIFDPLGLAKGDFSDLKQKEIKNGRLAMVAFVGFIVQERLTGLNPLAALQLHLSSPGQHTVFTNWAPGF
eukprot:gnl/MRDRNA2_/MRDRNA2_84808_c3_seq1.p1 gnl/MRDRNA2_/MRDRNA2_84808_c3~~gnl/MRDRNA2_/MRDRNA2_84808_c3_seq1.p1  ORF type:complete len:214 (-),score=17.54 gnl/MRDRNA2_/MRDRNA2_84808_c3_seq1:543-1097(-)